MNRKGKYANGVPWYTTGIGEIRVNFPTDDVYCERCLYLKNDGLQRPWCGLTKTLVHNLYGIGDFCPLTNFIVIGKSEEKKENGRQ